MTPSGSLVVAAVVCLGVGVPLVAPMMRWWRAACSGVRLNPLILIAMGLRQQASDEILDAYVRGIREEIWRNDRGGLGQLSLLEAISLAGGSAGACVDALVLARRKSVGVTLSDVGRLSLMGLDPREEVCSLLPGDLLNVPVGE